MPEFIKASAIKLFGKTISAFPPAKAVSGIMVPEQRQGSSETSSSHVSKDASREELTWSKHEDDSINRTEESLLTEAASSGMSNDPNMPCPEKDSVKEDELSESSDSQEKTLKKPDKILPCPRCSSMDTKFCYYNNYNVNQPRYYCRNCQRYWTNGGAMRNVPVGSGRRKNKNAYAPNYSIPDTLQATQADVIDGIHFSSSNPNSFLIFGSDRPLCEPMTSSSTEGSQNCPPYEFDDHSGRSSAFPVAFYPATPYWGCAIPSPWNGQWVSPTSFSSPSALSSSHTPALGKHSREGTKLGPSDENSSKKVSAVRPVLIPKTLRIHDPNEAAKSSIWSALGIKKDKIGSSNGTSLFKAFDRNSNMDNATIVLQANPAAFSRSLDFHETAAI